MIEGCAVVVPWHQEEQLEAFLNAWQAADRPSWLILQHDTRKEGCGATKNRGIEQAINRGAEIVVVLDDDCFPGGPATSLHRLADLHCQALEPQPVPLFAVVTDPPSRGTPYFDRTVMMPTAASMGFWHDVPDYCAVRQLAFSGAEMTFRREPIFGRYFPLCGMNLAFRPRDWLPWCRFIDVPRFDDIWMGWLWQREAYRRGFCFNLSGPFVSHARQSNVWQNLVEESKYLELNEVLWREIATHPSDSYGSLAALLPEEVRP